MRVTLVLPTSGEGKGAILDIAEGMAEMDVVALGRYRDHLARLPLYLFVLRLYGV